MIKVEKEEHRQALTQAHIKQNQNALALGVCVASFEQARDDLLRAAYGKPEYLHRLGALTHEFEGQKAFFLETIRRTQGEQRRAGEAALRGLGLDPTNETYTLDLGSWVVSKLVAGAWVQEFKATKPKKTKE